MSECCTSCDVREAKARADGRIAPDDVPVTMAELQEIWEMAREDGRTCNGVTGAVLAERYGDRLYHVTGVGWFVRRPSCPEGCGGTVDSTGRHSDDVDYCYALSQQAKGDSGEPLD